MKSPIVLYYRTRTLEDINVTNSIKTNLLSTLSGLGVSSNSPDYSSISVRLMSDINGVPNSNIISIFGIRTPQDKLLGLPALYNETVTIQTPTGLINGQAIYGDDGEFGKETTVPNVQYAVGANSGEFYGAKIINIFFDNITYTRKVIITF